MADYDKLSRLLGIECHALIVSVGGGISVFYTVHTVFILFTIDTIHHMVFRTI